MAARKDSAKADDTEPEAVEELEGGGFDETPAEEDLEETSLDEVFAEEEADVETGPEPDLDNDPAELTAAPVDVDEEDGTTPTETVRSADTAFDAEEEDDEGIVAAVAGEEDDQEIDGLREGEFVCRSCYMAKRDTQLADPERLLCRDCA